VLAGSYDSFQPDAPAVVATMGRTTRLLEIPHAAHGARGAGACVRELTSTFLAAPSAPLDTSCISGMVPPPFLTDVSPLRGVVATAQALAQGQPPRPALLLAGAMALATLLAALWAALRRSRRAGALAWVWAVAAGSVAATAGPVALLASTDPMASAALMYGLPAGWSWLPWVSLLPALLGVALLLRAAPAWTFPSAGTAAIACTLALLIAGWSPLG
jgi:hypothetical protein